MLGLWGFASVADGQFPLGFGIPLLDRRQGAVNSILAVLLFAAAVIPCRAAPGQVDRFQGTEIEVRT